MPNKMNITENLETQAFISNRIIFSDGIRPAILVVRGGKIQKIYHNVQANDIHHILKDYPDIVIEDFGSSVLMPGVIDSHVHVNEPGRTDWEGFYTATSAAAAGGITTIIDMPLNSIPPTTTVDNLKTKAKVALGKTFVDVGFWGGVVPGNEKELRPLIDAGVIGFKCFLCPSGIDEFPHVAFEDVRKALVELQSTNSVLAFHAECELEEKPNTLKDDPTLYETYLRSRPAQMEKNAIKIISSVCKEYGVRCHIVHLSASDALDLVKAAKDDGALLTAETCHHYLNLCAEQVPKGATEFKCCPPIRDQSNQDKLWKGLKQGVLDMVVSDHSPCTVELKGCSGDFLTAWGGISSLQFGLSLMWTGAKARGFNLQDVSRLLTTIPAKLCSIDNRKGSLQEGMDADFVIWDPEKSITVNQPMVLHKNKLTPYLGAKLFGEVLATVVRGHFVYKYGELSDKPVGNLLLNEYLLK